MADTPDTSLIPPRRSVLPVLLGGLITTALTLVGVWYLAGVSDDANIMGWYADYVIPIGPLIVGLVAGLGYSIASRKTGVRISGRLLWTILFLQVAAYFIAQFIEFHRFERLVAALVERGSIRVKYAPSFWEWFDHMTRSFAFAEQGKEAGSPLGAWGYGVRALELLGFAGGGVVAPAVLKTVPYCSRCQVYMRSKTFGVLPAGVQPRKVRKGDETGLAAHQQELEAALASGKEQLERLREWAKDGRVSDVQSLIERLKPQQKEIARQTSRIVWRIHRCRVCHEGYLSAGLQTGQGQEVSTLELGHSPAHAGLEHELA
ncbi:MAG: hypothetical protein HYU66_16010 [Armatimonadetes bacterium]|nr:hypothetical protein [Armatimonadota bacterium]